MSSLQSLRELISQRLAAAAEEICRLCEGTIVQQYEEELCRQRRLLDVIWKPQLQLHHIVLPQHWMSEEEDQCNQQMNFRVEQKEPEPPQIKEEQEEPEPPQIKEEPGELCISQDEDHLHLKQETDTLMEIPTYEEDEKSEADLKNQQSFNVTDSQDEEGNQHEESTSTTDEETESTSTTDEETDPQNRDQRKRRDRSHVQSVDSSHMSAAGTPEMSETKKTCHGWRCRPPCGQFFPSQLLAYGESGGNDSRLQWDERQRLLNGGSDVTGSPRVPAEDPLNSSSSRSEAEDEE
ncbi:uncharacterized protein LOC144989196 isoform X6 [Oryzias latipes]